MFIAANMRPSFQRRSEGRNSGWHVLIQHHPAPPNGAEFYGVLVYKHPTPTE
ncbi:MAG: hypothetical protein ABR568_12945 [Pyrinomonadaceae bacterium]